MSTEPRTQNPKARPRKTTQRRFFFFAALIETEEEITTQPESTPPSPPGIDHADGFKDERPTIPGMRKAVAVVIPFPFRKVAAHR